MTPGLAPFPESSIRTNHPTPPTLPSLPELQERPPEPEEDPQGPTEATGEDLFFSGSNVEAERRMEERERESLV